MSVPSIPFHLRPNKHIDRRLFVEALGKLFKVRPVTSYGYICMGGAFLEDSRLIYGEFGIDRIVSIERDEREHSRQVFNRPFPFVRCRQFDVGELVERYDDCLADLTDPEFVVIWLDYQSPKRDQQLANLREIAPRLNGYDIIRVTLNANPTTLDDVAVPEDQILSPISDDQSDTPASADMERRRRRLRKLEHQLGAFSPAEVDANDITRRRLPGILSKAAYLALRNGIGPNLVVQSIANFAYNDGQTMLTVTAAVWPDSEVDANVENSGLGSWPFFSATAADVHRIEVPSLSMRERIEIDRADVEVTGVEVVDILGVATVDDYRRFQRYYPIFARVAV